MAKFDTSSTFTVRIPQTVADRILNDMPTTDARALLNFANRYLVVNPDTVGTPLRGALKGKYGVQTGVHRIVYTVDRKEMIVNVLFAERM